MPIRQAIAPTPYLFTDERVDEAALLRAVRRLPRGGVVVFRHYQWPEAERMTLYRRLRSITRRRGVMLFIGGERPERYRGGDAWHQGRAPMRNGLIAYHSAGVHDWRELNIARRRGVAIVFISPVFATRSHKGARALGPLTYQQMARRAEALGMTPLPLGGMSAARARMMKAVGFGAIDSLSA
jgi:thiamine-phosphate pyrophosphorylase